MIIVLRPDATDEQIAHVKEKLEAVGLAVHVSKGKERTVLGAIGDERVLMEQLSAHFREWRRLSQSLNLTSLQAGSFMQIIQLSI